MAFDSRRRRGRVGGEGRKSTKRLPLTSLAVFESGTERSDLITGSNLYSHLTSDLPGRQHGKSAGYSGSAWELWIRKVLIQVKMLGPGGNEIEKEEG